MKKNDYYPVLIGWLLVQAFISSCNGQSDKNPTANPQPGPVMPLDTAGIDDYVVETFEDKSGNLWFGTIAQGAARYDGNTLTYISTKDGLCDNTIVSMTQDRAGNIWFGTHNGVSRYDGKTYTNYQQAEGIHGPGCCILADSKGNIWAGTNDGLFRFNGIGFSPFDIPVPALETKSYKWVAGKIWCITEDSKGNIWFGRDGYGAAKFDGSTFTHFTQKDGLCSNNVSAITEDNSGNIWFGTLSSDFPTFVNNGGVCRYDGNTFTRFTDVNGLFKNDIYTIYKEKNGHIWLGATHVGAYRYDGEKFDFFDQTNRKDLTVHFGVQGILQDRHGVLWFGFSGGLFRFNDKSFDYITRSGPWK